MVTGVRPSTAWPDSIAWIVRVLIGFGWSTHTHSVVPPCYRQHFPDAMKSHLSHDIVLLCVPCKQTVNTAVHARMVRSWFGGFF
jgi:hypothetical protein